MTTTVPCSDRISSTFVSILVNGHDRVKIDWRLESWQTNTSDEISDITGIDHERSLKT